MNDSFYQYYDKYDYDDLFKVKYLKSRDSGSLIPHVLLKCILALVSRIGFILIQVGSVPVENVYTIVISNLLEISVAILSYGLIGNLIAFGPDTARGWVSLSKWEWDDVSSMTQDLDGSLIGFCSVLLASAQMSSFIVGRTRMAGGIILTTFYCAVFQPFLLHWIWHKRGWMKHSKLLGRYVSVQDQGGALALHIPSVIFGAVGSLFLGRRILKLRDVDGLSFGTENLVATLIGYLLIIFNYIIFALPVYELDNETSAVVVINSFLALGGGIFAVSIIQRCIFHKMFCHRRIIRSVQGGIAALISVAAVVNLYSPSGTIIISIITSIVFFFFAEVIHNTALEDPCSFISSHLVCGFVGVMLYPLLVQDYYLAKTPRIKALRVNFLWQFICVCVVIGISIVAALFAFVMLKILHVLRNDSEIVNHRRAAVLRDALPKRRFLERLFRVNTRTDYVVPGYRESYLDTGGVVGRERSAVLTSDSLSDGDRIRKHVTWLVRGKNIPGLSSNWAMCGSGDYNLYADEVQASNFKIPTEISTVL